VGEGRGGKGASGGGRGGERVIRFPLIPRQEAAPRGAVAQRLKIQKEKPHMHLALGSCRHIGAGVMKGRGEMHRHPAGRPRGLHSGQRVNSSSWPAGESTNRLRVCRRPLSMWLDLSTAYFCTAVSTQFLNNKVSLILNRINIKIINTEILEPVLHRLAQNCTTFIDK
jgi:hypothetical protein